MMGAWAMLASGIRCRQRLACVFNGRDLVCNWNRKFKRLLV